MMKKVFNFKCQKGGNDLEDDVNKTEVEGNAPGDQAENTGEGETKATPAAPETWDSKIIYFLTLVGYAVGFGNVWRFPYLLHSNGGVAFMIPYLFMLAVVGIPMFFLELAIGQRMRKGPVGSWNSISPYLSGVGVSSGCICLLVGLYYNTLIAWVFSYIFDTFKVPLPWSSCERASYGAVSYPFDNGSYYTEFDQDDLPKQAECLGSSAPQYWWYRRTLQAADSITDNTVWNWPMYGYLCLTWAMMLAIVIKGMKSAGKISYFTAVFPYFVLISFFIGNFTQDGFSNGYYYLLNPDWSKLALFRTWLIAGTQIFFSLGLAFGSLIAFASILPSNNNCYRDAIYVSIINCSTSFFAACVIFPILGIKGTQNYKECLVNRVTETKLLLGLDPNSTIEVSPPEEGFVDWVLVNGEQNLTFDFTLAPESCNLEVFVKSSGGGTGLVYIAFTEAVTNFPLPNLWAFMFFAMLLTLGVGSSFGTIEGALNAFSELHCFKCPRWVASLIVVGLMFGFCLIFVPGSGVYTLDFIDQFAANYTLLVIAFFECVAISWFYGLARFSYDIKLMTGSKPNMYLLVMWKFVAPLVLLVIFIGSVVTDISSGISYSPWIEDLAGSQKKAYPTWLLFVGYLIMLAGIIAIPLGIILALLKRPLLKEEVPNYFPEEELRQERNIPENDTDPDQYDNLEKLVMGDSVHELNLDREKSRSKININLSEEKIA